eukprot:UN04285
MILVIFAQNRSKSILIELLYYHQIIDFFNLKILKLST